MLKQLNATVAFLFPLAMIAGGLLLSVSSSLRISLAAVCLHAFAGLVSHTQPEGYKVLVRCNCILIVLMYRHTESIA